MADISWSDLFGQALQAGVGYMQNQMMLKQAKQMARLSAPSGGFSRLGTGNMAFAGTPGPLASPVYGYGGQMYPTAMPAAYTLPAAPAGSTSPLTDLGSMLGLTSPVSGAAVPCSLFTAPTSSPRPRAQRLVMQPNPVTGEMHYWRHVGAPILFRGDIAHCRAVEKLLGRGRARLHRGRRRPR